MPQKVFRFSQLIKSSGKPSVAAIWGDPKKDRSFARAIKENRVVTVTQNPVGNKADFGRIGFHQDKYVSYFVFPQPLPEGKDARVIGIKYESLKSGKAVGGKVKAAAPEKKLKAKPKAKKVEPKENEFLVTVKRTAIVEMVVSVKAPGFDAATERALSQIREESFNPKEAVVRDEVRAVEERN